MIINDCELSNGSRLLHVRCKGDVSIFGAMINAGSRDEMPGEHGFAHLVEHMLFKGTTHRDYAQIINRVEDVGGDINAFTTKEDTSLYTIFLKRYLPRMVELICDMVFNPEFTDEMLRRETEVIRDEIDSYSDNPIELILDDFEDVIFSGSPIGHNILGEKRTISAATRQKVSAFYKRCYTNGRITFFCMGEYDFERVRKLLEKHTSGSGAIDKEASRMPPAAYSPRKLYLKKRTQQVHCVLGNRAYRATDERRPALALLNNLLGGNCLSSRLNMSLRENHGLVYTVESQYTPYSDTGNWNIYMGADRSDICKAVSLAKSELSKLCENRLPEKELSKAKRKFLAQMTLGGEVKENWILAAVRQYTEYGRIFEKNEAEAAVNSISPEQLREAACDIFDENKISELYYE